MAKLLYNPDNGAQIADVIVGGTTYFSSQDDLEFRPGDIVKMEDANAADVILETFGFVQEITVGEAKGIKDRREKNKFHCEECDFSTDEEKKLQGHMLHHAKEEKIDKELGVRVVTGNKREKLVDQVDPQDSIDRQASADGLIGEGLTKERI